MKDIKTLLLVMLTAGLVGTWVYHLYDKTQYTKQHTASIDTSATLRAGKVKDSLSKIYGSTINDLDTKLLLTKTNADSLQHKLANRIADIDNLKSEISTILKNSSSTNEDLEVASKKINELQSLVGGLRTDKNTMEEEKKQLTNVMLQLNGDIDNLKQNVQQLGEENRLLKEKVNQASVFVASDLNLVPVDIKNGREQETNNSRRVEKLIVSFNLQNNTNQYSGVEVYVIITQPNGKILTGNDVWESYTATSAKGTKFTYTRKMRFDYEKGETKNMITSIDADEFMKGTYTFQLFHKGVLIGQVMKTLS